MTAREGSESSDVFDYVVIGGGSAGCIAAAELARDGSRRVLLLELGGSAEAHPETLRSDGYQQAFVNPRLMFERFSVTQAGCAGRRKYMGSGRVIGGSGAVNAMVYTRGARDDYAEWPAGWHWDDVAGDFTAIERTLAVRRRERTAFTEACIEAAERVGFRRKEDLNDGALTGALGYEWMNFMGEERRSSYAAFLKPLGDRPNLRIVTGAHAERVELDRERRVRAVAYRAGGKRQRAMVRREVVVCAGALESPKLLMLSGIGSGELLRLHGIDVMHDSPEVGRNFHDHPNVTLFFLGRREVDCFYPQLYGFHCDEPHGALATEQANTCYVMYPARSSFREGMIKLLPSMALPPRLYAVPALPAAIRGAISLAFQSTLLRRFVARMWGVVVILGKPKSRGTVRLDSRDPHADARIDPGYFGDAADMDTMIAAIARARRLANAPALAAWGNRELIPGSWASSRAAVERFVRSNVMTTYHYAGTCRMGDDPLAVVTPRLEVRGVRGLRVADASVMPTAPVAALNAPSMLIGYRAAAFIREDEARS
jgi:choline dehydrogenase